MFDNILLEPVQEELLITLVEAARNVPLEQRSKFAVAEWAGGASLMHPGLPQDKRRIYIGDMEALARDGLLAHTYTSRGTPTFDVTPLGFRYYEHLIERRGEPVQRVETTIRTYLHAHTFQQQYSKAYNLWSSAEQLLWQTETDQQRTTVGHLCRESVQEFADALVQRYQPPGVMLDKTKTVARLKAVLDQRANRLGDTEKLFLDALLHYWGTVNDLIQRQEHGAQKEGQPLVWEDARRLVFQTMVVMFEIDRALQRT